MTTNQRTQTVERMALVMERGNAALAAALRDLEAVAALWDRSGGSLGKALALAQ